jgi:hypothetical protein
MTVKRVIKNIILIILAVSLLAAIVVIAQEPAQPGTGDGLCDSSAYPYPYPGNCDKYLPVIFKEAPPPPTLPDANP